MKTTIAAIINACVNGSPYWWSADHETACRAEMAAAETRRSAAIAAENARFAELVAEEKALQAEPYSTDWLNRKMDLSERFIAQSQRGVAAVCMSGADEAALEYLRDHNDAGNAELAARPGWRGGPCVIRRGFGLAGIQYRDATGQDRSAVHSGPNGDFAITRLC